MGMGSYSMTECKRHGFHGAQLHSYVLACASGGQGAVVVEAKRKRTLLGAMTGLITQQGLRTLLHSEWLFFFNLITY